MLEVLKTNRTFFILFLIYLFNGAFIIYLFPKGDIEILLNDQHNSILDLFFQYITYVGDGLFLSILLLIVLLKNLYYGIVGASIFVITTLITHFFKRIIFADWERPLRFFEGIREMYYIKDLEIHSYNSFPSGHTSAAFCIFTFLALISKNKQLGVLFFFAAFIVATSRMYLLQHFFMDTYFGAIIGVVCCVSIFVIFENNKNLKTRLYRPTFRRLAS